MFEFGTDFASADLKEIEKNIELVKMALEKSLERRNEMTMILTILQAFRIKKLCPDITAYYTVLNFSFLESKESVKAFMDTLRDMFDKYMITFHYKLLKPIPVVKVKIAFWDDAAFSKIKVLKNPEAKVRENKNNLQLKEGTRELTGEVEDTEKYKQVSYSSIFDED